jgi:subtilisin family serine protease
MYKQRWRTYPNGRYDADVVADFSSQGPAEDGRIKPEVVAPGYYTLSAWASGYSPHPTCKIHYEQGTSMATPATAGAAALVREYLSGSAAGGADSNSSLYAKHTTRLSKQLNVEEGNCIPGYPCNSGIPQPTGMLVKAILIHSTAVRY